MNRYIVASPNACAVFFDVTATSPLDAIQSGENEVAGEKIEYDWCQRGDADAIYSAYLAPAGFQEVVADDYGMVVEQCEYVASFKRARVEEDAQ